MSKGMYGNCFHNVIIVHLKKSYSFIVINFLQFLIFLHDFPEQKPIYITFSVFVAVHL